MADTGATVWAAGLWADDFWAAGLWSSGDAPPVSVTEQPSGGFWPEYDRFAHERRRRKREQEEREAEAKDLQDELDRQIALQFRQKEAEEADRADLKRIQALADVHSGKKLGLPKRVSDALINASVERTRNSLQQLQREIERAQDDEEMSFIVSMLLLD